MALSNQEISELVQKLRERLRAINLSRYGELSTKLKAVLAGMERLQTLDRRLQICTSRHWFAAAAEVASRLTDGLGWLTRDMDGLQDAASRLDMSIPSVAELAAELRQAENEFDQLRYDRKNQFVAVATDPITLGDVYLGEFEIRLLLSSRNTSTSQNEMYRIVALDPHPASSDDSVTHPHVRNESLCAGEAGAAIRSALAQGRVCDFFLLVKSVLSQYNSGSPYVSLVNWESGTCYDCECSFGSGAYYTCPACENDFCDDCMSYCRHCDNSYCQECLTTCSACDESVCSGCITRCPDCRKAICKTCLEDNQCPCQQEKENDDEPTNETVAAAAV